MFWFSQFCEEVPWVVVQKEFVATSVDDKFGHRQTRIVSCKNLAKLLFLDLVPIHNNNISLSQMNCAL